MRFLLSIAFLISLWILSVSAGAAARDATSNLSALRDRVASASNKHAKAARAAQSSPACSDSYPDNVPSGSCYLGCYPQSSTFTVVGDLNGGMTPQGCSAAANANDATYYGLQSSGFCVISNTPPTGSISSNGCNTQCSSDNTQRCGGTAYTDVFLIQFSTPAMGGATYFTS